MTTMSDAVGGMPTHEEIRKEIERIAVSDVFARSPQLGAFLRFVVESVLHGKADRIKAYTIGVEVLRRDTRFDPQLDPIVRVEATRLRRAIERYYAGPGVGDPVIVDLPRGSYVPTFRKREVAAPSLLQRAMPSAGHGPWPLVALGCGAALVAAAVLAAVILLPGDDTNLQARASVSLPMNGTVRAGDGMPLLLVRRPQVIGDEQPNARVRAVLFDAMRSAFPRFDTIGIQFEPEHAVAGVTVDYRLSSTIDGGPERPTNIRLHLEDGIEGVTVWSGDYQLPAERREPGAAERRIAGEIAARLFQPFGVVRAHQRAKHLSSNAGDPRYRCIVEASESFRSFDPSHHRIARDCLERLTARHPDFGEGLMYLGAIYYREYQYGIGDRAGDPPVLDLALRVARRAIELNPESARAYQILFAVLFGRRDFAAAFAAGEKAMALNPADRTVAGDYGGRLILTGEVERGMTYLLQTDIGAIRPSWYHFYVFLGRYLSGDRAGAASEASLITAASFPLGYVARALAVGAQGDGEGARREFERLKALNPAWREDTRQQLLRFIPGSEVAERLLRDLVALGLAPQS